MRRLTLLRHAHAEDQQPGGGDFERRLDEQGLQQAQRSAKRLLASYPAPTLILASPAQRTRTTAQVLREAAALPAAALRFDERLYNATRADLFAVLHAVDAQVVHLVMVGHNPGISEFGRELTRAAPEGLATAQFCSASFTAATWRDIE